MWASPPFRHTPSHASWPHRELHRRPQWRRPHASRTTQYSASWPHRELHRRPKWLRSHARTAPVSAHPSHVSWPHREPHRRPKWLRSHARTAPISAHPSHVSWPHRGLHRRPLVHFGIPLARFVAPQVFPPKASGQFRHTSLVSWPHRGLHRRLQVNFGTRLLGVPMGRWEFGVVGRRRRRKIVRSIIIATTARGNPRALTKCMKHGKHLIWCVFRLGLGCAGQREINVDGNYSWPITNKSILGP